MLLLLAMKIQHRKKLQIDYMFMRIIIEHTIKNISFVEQLYCQILLDNQGIIKEINETFSAITADGF